MKSFKTTIFNRFFLTHVNPILFDVSLRDGIQGATLDKYTTAKKLELLHLIREKYDPPKMEIGAFVSPKVLPIMSDSPAIFDHANNGIPSQDKPELYALVPNKTGLLIAIDNNVTHFSFITSVSNAFQIKNTRRNIDTKKSELQQMMNILSEYTVGSKTKLYISCINECPITGKIDNDFIMHEILSSYGKLDIDEICLSDTMGTLRCRDFEYIVDGLIRFGIAKTRISLHLHVDDSNATDAKNILFACFARGINKFDVSILSEGGCSVTMDASRMKPNMSYEFFYNVLSEYIDEDIREYNGL